MKKLFLIFTISWFVAACASWFNSDNTHLSAMEQQDRAALDAIFIQIAKGETAKAEEELVRFLETRKSSYFYQWSQMARARIFESRGEWSKAIEIYRAVLNESLNKHPELAGQALYLSSFAYEAVGDDLKALAALLDADKRRKFLYEEQALAELPARLSSIYAKMGRDKESAEFATTAQRGVAQVEANLTSSGEVLLAKTYYLMGVLSVNQLATDNFQRHLDMQMAAQRFLIRSIEKEVEPWSRLAADNLKQNYQNYWNLILNYPLNQTMELGVAKRERAERQVHFLNEMANLFSDLDRYRSPNPKSDSGFEAGTFTFISTIKEQMNPLLASITEISPLTSEAEARQGLRRSGLKLIPVEPSRTDPNL